MHSGILNLIQDLTPKKMVKYKYEDDYEDWTVKDHILQMLERIQELEVRVIDLEHDAVIKEGSSLSKKLNEDGSHKLPIN